MSLEDRLNKKTAAIFTSFVASLGKVDPITAAVIAAGVGSLILTAGFTQEIAHQSALISEGGKAAVDAYRATTPSTVLQFMGRALAGDMPSAGLHTQGVGAWALLTLPPVAYAAAKLVKGLEFVRDAIDQDNRMHRPRGASRVEQLTAGLAGVNQAFDHPSDKASPGTRGLR